MVKNVVMQILLVQKKQNIVEQVVIVSVAVSHLFFHKTIERNFLLYSEASVDDQTGVCVAKDG